ncbi:hypothetical protein LCGC14_0454220 [marine sediment metagenome]|uniref:Uncharacterized protein n=1 Tax=marine sediment metagenome TaxID=412755 RepID=A0A0F9T053_9ZZZZ
MKIDEKTGKKIPETPEEAFALWDENLSMKDKSHCCECERGILHSICMYYDSCQATSEENCNYKFSSEYIVINYNQITGQAKSVEMKWEEYLEYCKTNTLTKLSDYGLTTIE